MKVKIAILIISIILILGCDRFDRNFEVIDDVLPIAPFFNQFAAALQNVTEVSLPEVMNYYDDDYSNNGWTKSDIEVLYNSFIEDELAITVTLLDTTNAPNITWNLLAEDGAKEVVYDEDITDVLVVRENEYIFFGDQADKANVIVELFTGTWCTYCPFVEEALHELKEQYGSRLSYVEYHIGDPLDNGFGVLLNYYPNQGTLPITIINGNAEILTTAGEETQDEIEAVLLPLLEEPLTARLNDAAAVIEENVLTGSVNIDIDTDIPLDDLKLVLILQEDTNSDYTNYNGEILHNVVMERRVLDIATHSQLMEFSISDLDVLLPAYEGLPEDLTLVIWIQKLEDSYDQSTCKAYNVIELTVDQIENR
jgi:thiol-disulfide isomerase/thioredoxin